MLVFVWSQDSLSIQVALSTSVKSTQKEEEEEGSKTKNKKCLHWNMTLNIISAFKKRYPDQ